MKKYRRVMSHETKECGKFEEKNSWFQKWHEEFGKIQCEQWQVIEWIFTQVVESNVR